MWRLFISLAVLLSGCEPSGCSTGYGYGWGPPWYKQVGELPDGGDASVLADGGDAAVDAGTDAGGEYVTAHSIDFDGVGPDSIECGYESFDCSAGCSWGTWIKLDAIDSASGNQDFNTQWSSITGRSWTFRHDGDDTTPQWKVFWGDGTTVGSCSGAVNNTTCDAGEWCFFGVKYDDSTILRVYQAGEGDATLTASTLSVAGCLNYGTNASTPMEFGSSSGGAVPLSGRISEAWMYDSLLSDAEFAELARETDCDEGASYCPAKADDSTLGQPLRWWNASDATSGTLVENGSSGSNCTTWNNTPTIVADGP